MKHGTGWMALAVLAASTLGAQAQRVQVKVQNNTDHAVWATVYEYAHHAAKTGEGCVLPHTTEPIQGYKYPFKYYVLVEVKASATSCADPSNILSRDAGRFENLNLKIDPLYSRDGTMTKIDIRN